MELEEGEDEERDTNKYYYYYSSEPNASKNDGKVKWVLNKGLKLGKRVLVAGFVASSVPIVVPPLVVASAIGLAVSMPYALFLASHAFSQCLMSKLLPRPIPPQQIPLLHEVPFQPHNDIEEEQYIEMVDAHDGSRKYINGFWCEEEIALPRNDDNDVKNGAKVDGEIGYEVEELKTLTSVVFEEQAIEGDDIEEEELQRETKGLLEKIRDEGRTDNTGRREYVEGGTNDSDRKTGSVVEEAREDEHGCIIEGTEEGCIIEGTEEGVLGNEEDQEVCEKIMLLRSRNDENICNEVEFDEPLLQGKEVDITNEPQKPYDTTPAEPIQTQVYNISVAEDSSEGIGDINIVVEEEPKSLPVGATSTRPQREKFYNIISDCANEESQLHDMMDSTNADAREVALDLFDEKGIDLDLQKESSNVGEHTDSMEVLVSSVEQESMPSECSSQEVVLEEENIWREIHVIRKIVGYEGTIQASCAQELKALYIFTGVEPPAFLNEDAKDPIEIKEKLHFLMSIVGIKSK